MCLKIQPPWLMPQETGQIGKMVLGEKSPYRLIGDPLFEKLNETDFADLYPAEGQTGWLPVILAFVTAFQFMVKLPDRQAVV